MIGLALNLVRTMSSLDIAAGGAAVVAARFVSNSRANVLAVVALAVLLSRVSSSVLNQSCP